MVASRAGGSRAASVFSTTTARDTLKKRDKPWKTEQQKVVAKKRRLAINKSYSTTAPRGYTFLPVGTPDLAELCKELSRQRSLPINIVSAAPRNARAIDPGKLSHHVHRIGYHFQNTVLEDACEELGYFPYKDQYVKPIDLQKKAQDSYLAQVLKKHGVKAPDAGRESVQQVRDAIKELFPRIPEQDLTEIVKHAWKEGTDRVGTVTDLDLGRRVQLAVIARIRHQYTDYDQLLRAFGWLDARSEVEPVTLRKLIEWRGEHDNEDNELEEIVRETIVIDDEDGNAANTPIGIEDGASSDAGNVSDTSVEISHRPAGAHDLRAEEAGERDHWYAQRWHRQTARRTEAERTDIARAKISAAREHRPDARPQTIVVRRPGPRPGTLQWDARAEHVPCDGVLGNTNSHSGSGTPLQHVHHPAPRPHDPPKQPQMFVDPLTGPPQRPSLILPGLPQWSQHQPLHQPMRSVYPDPVDTRPTHEMPLPSIEQDGSPRQLLRGYDRMGALPSLSARAHHSRPATPESGRRQKRARVPAATSRSSPDNLTYREGDNNSSRRNVVPDWNGRTIDLTSPRRTDYVQQAPQPQVIRVRATADGFYEPIHAGPAGYPTCAEAPVPMPAPDRSGHYQAVQGQFDQPPAGYNPNQPLLLDRDYERRREYEPVRTAEPGPAPLPAYQERPPVWSDNSFGPPQQPHYAGQPAAHDTHHAGAVYQVRLPGLNGQRRAPPAPVHGAPAPVQQMPREAPHQQPQPRAVAYHHPYSADRMNRQVNFQGSAYPPAEQVYPR